MPSLLGVLTLALSGPSQGAFSATAEQARGIAKLAYLYGFPVVEMYKTLYTQAVDQEGPNFKAPFNRIGGTAQVFSPTDTAFVTPHSDTPYSFAWLDLRAEPQVLSLPAPDGSFYGVLRIYLPKPDVSNGQWKMPLLTPVAPEQQ
ncbi:DUF1254 domain-containing protein [Pseudomonas sp. MWU349]|uniref:DUF1254 domain-containing protein n=1 Tax=Pseudomonas sp. MWU349 TaxID=2802572 RepID=UPI0024A65F5C|nr:DUF1254 domain-containing protein [Pseudomonas sp. MWU349]